MGRVDFVCGHILIAVILLAVDLLAVDLLAVDLLAKVISLLIKERSCHVYNNRSKYINMVSQLIQGVFKIVYIQQYSIHCQHISLQIYM